MTTQLTRRARQELTSGQTALIIAAGPAATFVCEEFFTAGIRNPHTRRAYGHTVRRFLAWAETQGHELARLTPGQVGGYLDELPGTVPTKKLHLIALRRFLNIILACDRSRTCAFTLRP